MHSEIGKNKEIFSTNSTYPPIKPDLIFELLFDLLNIQCCRDIKKEIRMKKLNFWIYIIILALIVVGLFVFVKYSNSIFESLQKTETRNELTQLKENIADADYKIYWIGEVPERLKDLKIEQVTSIDEKHLPLSYYTEENITYITNEFGKDAKQYESRDIYQDCPKYSFIVISREGLTDEDRQLFERCSRENGTYMIVLGEGPVKEYRDYLLKDTGITTDIHSMQITYSGDNRRNIFSKSSADDINSVSFSKEFLAYLNAKLPSVH